MTTRETLTPQKNASSLSAGDLDFFKTLRAIDFSRKELPPFVSELEGLTQPQRSSNKVYFRWNKSQTARILLNTPLFGKISVGVVAATPKKYDGSILITIGQHTREFGPNTVRVPAYQFTFDCRSPTTVIKFESYGGRRTFAVAYVSLQQES